MGIQEEIVMSTISVVVLDFKYWIGLMNVKCMTC